jgi:hypothetical protein
MPAICDSISSKLSENLSQSFKQKEKENFENHLAPTAKQVLSAKVEYEPVANYSNSILSTLQTKYIVLKPNQLALSSNGEKSLALIQLVCYLRVELTPCGASGVATSRVKNFAQYPPARALHERQHLVALHWPPSQTFSLSLQHIRKVEVTSFTSSLVSYGCTTRHTHDVRVFILANVER